MLNACFNTVTICTPPSTVFVEITDYSEVDAEIFALSQAAQPALEIFQPSAGQLTDFNDDFMGNFAAEPSSAGPFDGRVSRVIQANLFVDIAECLLLTDVVTLEATVTLTRTSATPPTVSDDGSIVIINTDTDAFLQSTVIMGGADGTLTETVSLALTKADLESGNIALLLGVQTQDGVLPTVNGVTWSDISISVSLSTAALCAEVPAHRTVGCNDDEIIELLEEIAIEIAGTSAASVVQSRLAIIPDAGTWPAALIAGKLQGYTVKFGVGVVADVVDLVTATAYALPPDSYSFSVKDKTQTLTTPTYTANGGSMVVTWEEEI